MLSLYLITRRCANDNLIKEVTDFRHFFQKKKKKSYWHISTSWFMNRKAHIIYAIVKVLSAHILFNRFLLLMFNASVVQYSRVDSHGRRKKKREFEKQKSHTWYLYIFLTSRIFHTSSHFTLHIAFSLLSGKKRERGENEWVSEWMKKCKKCSWNIYFIMHVQFSAQLTLLSDGVSINLHRISISHACYFVFTNAKTLHIFILSTRNVWIYVDWQLASERAGTSEVT